jgi:VWFA-related protein
MSRHAFAGTLVLSAVATAIATGAAQQRPTFRAVGALVTVEVEVRDGNRLVRGLTAADFQVTDNGVLQTIEMLDVESLPIDLTLVVDTSGSVEPSIVQLRFYAREAAMLLRVDDRFRLITFAGDVRDVYGLQPATELPAVETIHADGATAIFDALTAALMRTRQADRRQIIMAYTDGIETNSAIDGSALVSVAKRADSVLHVFLVRNPMYDPRLAASYPADTRRYWLSRIEMDNEALGQAAAATGGVMQILNVREQLPAFLRQTLEDYRTSYVLRYAPTGVKPEGWHTIEVRTASGHRVRARQGYFWGSLRKDGGR